MQSPNSGKPHATCGAKTRSGQPCHARPVRGTQRCRMHGGGSPGRPLLHGRYSLAHHDALAEKVDHFLSDPRPGELIDELALMRALLQSYLERFTGEIEAEDIGRVFGMVEAISRLVERVARIFNQTALTQVEVQLLEARIVDLVLRYVEPDRQIAFLDELRSSLGSSRRDEGAHRTIAAES